MNQSCEIAWALVAENDLKEIIDYIAIDNPANALKIFQEIKKKYPAYILCRKDAA
ncbi:MAG: type II toxin-antitoxin system RelE/ParE family toxin [Candidatus Desulfaltia sp.]|nr:type II toxin-antitoxin system RelE/ParE family toxin [Candidatus Desulfaltia sp.]